MSWHIPDDVLGRYLSDGLDPAQAMSVDAHLVACADCRATVPYEEEWLRESWQRLEAEVAKPSPSPADRLLRAGGVPEHVARLLTVTPSASRAWICSVVAALAFAVLAARQSAGLLPVFLTLAPVLPLAGIALAYGRRVDPAHELLSATPLSGPRLLMVRATAVLGVAVVLAALASPLLPAPPGLSAAWLLPSFAVTSGCLALSARLGVPLAALATGGLWLLGVAAVGGATGDWLTAFGAAAQIGYGCAALLLSLRLYRVTFT
ncbi:zf-HC2 domain-containing protein [Nonomuraea sp. NPDC000554]|uniref:zf-HC2 domain-containing protein n=1 Tax=Nonomuraea sp. NPDC000554 TaxID=3154259 RepID=UPI003328340F